jgi:hypothetical protein
LGARTPWYRTRLRRGGGTRAASFLDQLQGRQHQVGGTIRPRRLEAKGQTFVIDDLQSSRRQGWSSGVADQAFQAGAVVVVDAGGRSPRVCLLQLPHARAQVLKVARRRRPSKGLQGRHELDGKLLRCCWFVTYSSCCCMYLYLCLCSCDFGVSHA